MLFEALNKHIAVLWFLQLYLILYYPISIVYISKGDTWLHNIDFKKLIKKVITLFKVIDIMDFN